MIGAFWSDYGFHCQSYAGMQFKGQEVSDIWNLKLYGYFLW